MKYIFSLLFLAASFLQVYVYDGPATNYRFTGHDHSCSDMGFKLGSLTIRKHARSEQYQLIKQLQ